MEQEGEEPLDPPIGAEEARLYDLLQIGLDRYHAAQQLQKAQAQAEAEQQKAA